MQPAFRKLRKMSRELVPPSPPPQNPIDQLRDDLVPPSPPPPHQYPIDQLRNDKTIRVLAETLVISGGELVHKAKQILSRIPECEEGVEKFSNAVREIWPLLANGVRQVMYKVNVVGLVLRNSSNDSPTQRWARMKGDPSLESSLAILKPAAATTDFDIMRVFLILLIAYWGDKAELPKLDDANDKPGFGRRMFIHECLEKKGMPPPEKRVDKFSYKIENADDAKNMERVQEWLVSTYGDDNNVDRDALLEKIRSELSSNMKISLVSKFYDGKSKAAVHIRVADGCCKRVSISMSFWNSPKN